MYAAAAPSLVLERKRCVFAEYVTRPILRDRKKIKLSFDDAESIRAAYARGGITQKELAAQYGVTNSNISCVLNGKTFKHRHTVRS